MSEMLQKSLQVAVFPELSILPKRTTSRRSGRHEVGLAAALFRWLRWHIVTMQLPEVMAGKFCTVPG